MHLVVINRLVFGNLLNSVGYFFFDDLLSSWHILLVRLGLICSTLDQRLLYNMVVESPFFHMGDVSDRMQVVVLGQIVLMKAPTELLLLNGLLWRQSLEPLFIFVIISAV